MRGKMIRIKKNTIRRQLKRKPNTDQMLETAALHVVSDMVELAPVDTGELSNSLRILDKGTDYVEVGTDVSHGIHVEFGTKYSRAQPFLRPALLRAGFSIQEIKW